MYWPQTCQNEDMDSAEKFYLNVNFCVRVYWVTWLRLGGGTSKMLLFERALISEQHKSQRKYGKRLCSITNAAKITKIWSRNKNNTLLMKMSSTKEESIRLQGILRMMHHNFHVFNCDGFMNTLFSSEKKTLLLPLQVARCENYV